jgi:hypothetical protein
LYYILPIRLLYRMNGIRIRYSICLVLEEWVFVDEMQETEKRLH